MAGLLALLAPVAATDAAEEGKKIIIVMLIVGLTFVAIIALGDYLHHRANRRFERDLRRSPRY